MLLLELRRVLLRWEDWRWGVRLEVCLRTRMTVVLRPLVVVRARLLMCLRLSKAIIVVVAKLIGRVELRRRRWRRKVWIPWWALETRRRHMWRDVLVATAIPEARIVAASTWLERHRLRVHVVHIGG